MSNDTIRLLMIAVNCVNVWVIVMISIHILSNQIFLCIRRMISPHTLGNQILLYIRTTFLFSNLIIIIIIILLFVCWFFQRELSILWLLRAILSQVDLYMLLINLALVQLGRLIIRCSYFILFSELFPLSLLPGYQIHVSLWFNSSFFHCLGNSTATATAGYSWKSIWWKISTTYYLWNIWWYCPIPACHTAT